jgi:hypothetical protein
MRIVEHALPSFMHRGSRHAVEDDESSFHQLV